MKNYNSEHFNVVVLDGGVMMSGKPFTVVKGGAEVETIRRFINDIQDELSELKAWLEDEGIISMLEYAKEGVR